MSHDVFISHSVKDKTTADAVCAMLESSGIRCWIAPRDVTPSREWGECIIEAIKECRIMVLVFSDHANNSSQIRREVERAVNHGVAILPLRIEDVVPSSALEYFIGNVHWLDALTPPMENHLRSLVETVKMLLARIPVRDVPRHAIPIQPLAATLSKSEMVESIVSESAKAPPGSAGKQDVVVEPAQPSLSKPAAPKNPTERPLTPPLKVAPEIRRDLAQPLSEPGRSSPLRSISNVEEPPARRFGLPVVLGGLAILILGAIAIYFGWRSKAPPQFQQAYSLAGHLDEVHALAFSPDSKWLASGSDDHNIKFWKVSTGQIVNTLKGHGDKVESVAFSPDGHLLASGSGDKTAKIWDVVTGRELHTLTGHSDWVFSVAFSPDGRWLASGSGDKTIKIWETSTGQEVRTLVGHTGQVRSVAFSPDSLTLASGSGDATIILWDLATGHELRTMAGPPSGIQTVAFAPDGRLLASAGDQYIKLWNPQTGQEVRTLEGKSEYNYLNCLSFSPDGRWLATGSGDNVIRIRNPVSGEQVGYMDGRSGPVFALAYSPDGNWIAGGNWPINLWRRTN